jgi:putative transposase
MGRSARIQLAGGVQHISTRGDLQAPIFLDDHDRHTFLEMVGAVVMRRRCTLGRRSRTSPRAWKWLNGCYARAFNRRHKRLGHLFERPFHSVLVEDDSQLLAVHRYLALNPVRAKQVVQAEACRLPPGPRAAKSSSPRRAGSGSSARPSGTESAS